MSKVIGVTEARSKLRAIIDEVTRSKEAYILARGSKPEAVIMSYDEYVANQESKQESWNRRFDTATRKSRALFKEWLRDRGQDASKLSEEDLLRIIKSG